MNANEQHHLTTSAVPPFPHSPVSTEHPWEMHDDAESRQARHTAQFRAMHSPQLNPPSPSGHLENDVVIWNGQHCFDWVDPVDIRLSSLGDTPAEHSPPTITVIEYHWAQPSSHVDALSERLDVIEKRLRAICERIEQVVVPLAEENRALRNQELDMHVVRPILEHIIQTLSRMDDELRDETDGGIFGVLRDSREADREEQRQLLRHYGVSAKYPKRGDRFSASVHEVISRIATDSTERVGRVRRVIRPAYVRERDREVIRPAWVEVYVQANGVVRQ